MKVYTILATRDTAALKRFVQACIDCGAIGVTIFTHPYFTAPAQPEGTPLISELQKQADDAAASKDYKLAAHYQGEIEKVRANMQGGGDWITECCAPLSKTTVQVICLSTLHWPADLPFTPSNFFSKLDELSGKLCSTGLHGIIHKTPLSERVYIPIGAGTGQAVQRAAEKIALAGDGSGVQGEPATGSERAPIESPVPAPKSVARHPSLPANLTDKEAVFATYRLGLDRGGARRTRGEAGNLCGYSNNISAKMENAISAKWSIFLAKANSNETDV